MSLPDVADACTAAPSPRRAVLPRGRELYFQLLAEPGAVAHAAQALGLMATRMFARLLDA